MAKKQPMVTVSSGFAERQLTPGERALARQVFGGNIDYDQINLYSQKWPGSLSTDFSTGTENQKWVFMFEMAQVWRDQNKQEGAASAVSQEIQDSLTRWLSENSRTGFGHIVDPAKKLSDYTVEHQADIFVDYFRRKYRRGAPSRDDLLGLYDHLLACSGHHFEHEASDAHELIHQMHEQVSKLITTAVAGASFAVLGLSPAAVVGSGVATLGATGLNTANTRKDAFPMAELPEADKRTYLPRGIWLKYGFAPIDENNGRWLVVKDSQNQDQAIYMYAAKSVAAIKPEDQRSSVDVAREIYLNMAQDQLKETRLLVPSHEHRLDRDDR